jgi:hypothetical protein
VLRRDRVRALYRDRVTASAAGAGLLAGDGASTPAAWQRAGAWASLHRELLRRLDAAGRIDWSTAVIDGSHVGALFGGLHTGPSPVDRARTGSKHHLLTDATGVPLAISLTGGHRNDVTQLLSLIDGMAPIRGKIGRPRRRADRVLADRGYDHDKYRRALWARGVKP